jgi:hypothetical protein
MNSESSNIRAVIDIAGQLVQANAAGTLVTVSHKTYRTTHLLTSIEGTSA